MSSQQYQQWFQQWQQRNRPVQIQQSCEWFFQFSGIDQHGENVSYSVRMSGNSYGRAFSSACRRFYENFQFAQISSIQSSQ